MAKVGKKDKRGQKKSKETRSAVQQVEPLNLRLEIEESNNGKVRMMDEEHVAEIMDVLRATNTAISMDNFAERRKLKLEKVELKKFSNQNALNQELRKKDATKRSQIRSRIKEMKKAKSFPLPSVMVSNYRKKFGVLKLNSIKVD